MYQKKYSSIVIVQWTKKPLKNIWDKCKDLNRNKILVKSDYFFKSWGNENFEFDAEGKEIHPKRILI